MWMDARLPLRFGPLETRAPDEAVLTDGPASPPAPAATFEAASAPAHAPGCACCTPRSAAATALASLFRDRAISGARPFRSVLAVVGPPGEAAIRAALDTDPLVSARFRLAPA